MARQDKTNKRGVILINAYSKRPAVLEQVEQIRDEFAKLGINADIRRNNRFGATIDGKGDIACALSDYDFCVYLDKDKYVSEMLEKSGMRLFNSHKAVLVCDDKMCTSIALANNGIKMPKTLAGLLCYNPEESVAPETLDKVESLLGYPLIIKESYGSLGNGVFKVDDRAQLESAAQRLKCKSHLFQEFIASSYGRDLRVIVVGGKAVGAMERKAHGDFRSNIELGGEGRAYNLDNATAEIAERVSRILGLDYCGIDLLFADSGAPYVCEVNSNAFFAAFERVTGINVAECYARHIAREIYG